MNEKRFSPKNYTWVCMVCGKTSPYDRYGDEKSSRGWDESCILNSILIEENKLIKIENNIVIGVKDL